MSAAGRGRLAGVVVAWLLVACAAIGAAAQLDPLQAPREQLNRARALYDALEWEGALPVLDAAIADLAQRPLTEDGVRPLLASAYELRARSRFGLGNRDGARQDLTALVAIEPGHLLPDNVAAAVLHKIESNRRKRKRNSCDEK